jgi:hypothetical protein
VGVGPGPAPVWGGPIQAPLSAPKDYRYCSQQFF